MDYKLTSKYQHAKVLPNGKRRSVRLYFLNDIQIFKQKVPFDETSEYGAGKWLFKNEYLLNGYIYQTRRDNNSWDFISKSWIDGKSRDVHFPVSKRTLEPFNIPNDIKIDLTE
jgi:hypothetical protein